MKKLMTMLAAAVVAVGAFAEAFETGTAFSLVSGDPGALSTAVIKELGVQDPVAAGQSGFWAGLNDDVKVTAFGAAIPPAPFGRFESWVHANYLTVKTTLGTPVFRKVYDGKGDKTCYDFDEDATQIYFQGNVKFTAFDEEPSAEYSDAKILLYVKDLSQFETPSAETNLYAKVGDKEYKVASGIDIDAWHTLTIKTMKIAAGKLGFVVFLGKEATDVLSADTTITGLPTLTDPVAQYYASKNQLFPAAGTDTTITEVGFDGQGSVDQIAFSTNVLIPDPWLQTIKFGSTIAELYLNDGTTTYTLTTSPTNFQYDAGQTAYTYTYKAADGYVSQTVPQSITMGEQAEITIPDAAEAAAAVTIGSTTTYYETISAAVDAAKVSEVEGTLKLITASATDDVELNNALVTLDLNGQIVGGVGAADGAAVTLTNTDSEKIARISGTVNSTVVILSKNIQISSYNTDGDEFTFEYSFGGNAWKLVINGEWIEVQDLETWTVTVDATLGDHVTEIKATPNSLREDAEDKTVTLTATFETGYELDYYTVGGVKIESDSFQLTKSVTVNAVAKSSTIPVTLSVTLEKTEITEGDAIPTFTVKDGQDVADPAKYTAAWDPSEPTTESEAGEYTLTVTPKAPYTGDPASAKLTIKEKAAPVIDPTNPEKPVVVTAEDEDAAKDAVKISVPDAVKDAVDEEAYQAYFVKTATPNGDGTWNVTAALDDTVIESGETAAELAGKFDTITEAGVTVENAKPGLYYSVVEGQALTGREEGPRSLATSDGVTIKATKFDNSGFYQIKVSTTDNKVGD